MIKHLLLFIIFFKSIDVRAQSQCRIVVPSSTNSYSVIVAITLATVIPSSTSCPWGYNYNIALNYNVSFIGASPPASLTTLQGDFVCNTSQSFSFPLPKSGGAGTYTTTNNPYIASNGFNTYLTNPSCVAATVANLNCGQINVYIGGPDLPMTTVPCNYFSSLPIELISFSGYKLNTGISLNWETASERNNDFFEIEKNSNGSEWLSLAKIKGAGNSNSRKSYSFIYDESNTGLWYYRLKQVDFDKKFSYSKIIVIENTLDSAAIGTIWPNPVNTNLAFNVDAPVAQVLSYKILNDLGIEIKSGEKECIKGRTEINLDVENLPRGYYTLGLQFLNSKVIYKKIVKL